MNEKDKLIQLLIEEKGGSPEDYQKIIDKIAYHESAGTMDPSLKQYGGGPGRGKFQFEIGEDQGAVTASRRLSNYLKQKGESVPKWLSEINKSNSVDASKLTSEQQDMLFLGNMRKHPKADLKDVITGDQSLTDFWAKYHWAGKIKDRKDRVASFEASSKRFDKSVEQGNTPKEQPPLENDTPRRTTNNFPIQEAVRDNTNIRQPRVQQPITRKEENPQLPNNGGMEDLLGYINQKYQQPNQSKRPTDSNNLVNYNGGGTHEQNPLGGIPQGIGANGKPNSVESNETSFDLPGGKFVFSDRVAIGGKKREVSNSYNNQFALGGMIGPGGDDKEKQPKTAKTPTSSRPLVYTPVNVENQRQKQLDWYSNPVTNSRLRDNLKSIGQDPAKATTLLSDATDNTKNTSVHQVHSNDPHLEGSYKNNKINIYEAGRDNAEVLAHEFTHAGGVDKPLSAYIRKNYGSPFTNYRDRIAKEKGLNYNPETYMYEGGDKPMTGMKLVRSNFDTNYGFDSEKSMMDYLNKPGQGELYPRFQEMRNFLNVQPGQEITEDHINTLKSDPKMKFMFKYYSPEKIKNILNTVASNQSQNNTNKYKGLV